MVLFDAFDYRLQFRYGTHWAYVHPNEACGELAEITFGEDELLTHVTVGAGLIIDNIQFATNLRSFPSRGDQNKNPNKFISSAELLYFVGSEYDFGGLRVSGIAAMALSCSGN